MEMTQHAVSWFEISTSDFDRAKKFYETIFDYEMPEMDMGGMKMGILLHDQATGVGGAIIHATGHEPCQRGTTVYLNGGQDLSVVLNRIPAAGGEVQLGKTPIGDGMGYFAIFTDSEGNRVGLHSMQ